MHNQKGKVLKCPFQSKFKNGRRVPHQRAHTDLKILQWNAGGMSQNKKTELHLNLVKHNVDIFAIMETSLQLKNSSITSSADINSTAYQNIDKFPICGIQNSK